MVKSIYQLKTGKIIILIVILIVLGLASYYGYRYYLLKDQGIGNLDFQAVFLTTGQVYFGEIKSIDDNFVQMDNIYYLKTPDALQDGSDANKKITLVKLGEELHGPEDHMYINRDHVLFYEKMKNDSKIIDAINRFAENKNKDPQPAE